MIGKKVLGNLGEDLACDFLVKKGYKIYIDSYTNKKFCVAKK